MFCSNCNTKQLKNIIPYKIIKFRQDLIKVNQFRNESGMNQFVNNTGDNCYIRRVIKKIQLVYQLIHNIKAAL